MKRRRMDKFTLDEVSFVTRPAQEGAVAAIMKSDDLSRASVDELLGTAQKNGDLVSVVTSSVNGHQHGISVHRDSEANHGFWVRVQYATAEGEEAGHDHMVVVGPDGFSMTENHGHTHEIDQDAMRQALLAMVSKGLSIPEGGPLAVFLKRGDGGRKQIGSQEGKTMPDDDKKAAADLKEAQDRITKLEADLAKANALTSLGADERAFYDKLDGDEVREAFLAKSADDRKAEVAKAAESDPVVYKALDGTEFRKSDDPRMVAIVKQADHDRTELKKEREARAEEQLAKRAETELRHMPGDVTTRAAILKAVDGIEDEKVRAEAIAALKAKDARMSGAFQTVGKSTPDAGADPDHTSDRAAAEAKLDEMAKAHATKEGVPYAKAYAAVLETAEGSKLYAEAV